MTKKAALQPNSGIDSYIKENMPNGNAGNSGAGNISGGQLDPITRLKLRQDTAHYIHRMTADLCVMAAKSDLEFLAYLIDMARIEAYDRMRDNISQANAPQNNGPKDSVTVG